MHGCVTRLLSLRGGIVPRKLHRKLAAEARKKGYPPGSEKYNAYVYGGLRNTGWKPKREGKA